MDYIQQLDSDILVFIQEHLRNAPLSKFFIPITLASLIGISRLYVGVHYPTDVLCAAIIGTIMGSLTVRIFSLIEHRKDMDQ